MRRVTEKAKFRAIRGRTVLVTGASAGIGRRVAEQAARYGAEVVLVARSEEKLVEVADGIAAFGGDARYYAADLSLSESCEALLAALGRDGVVVDVLVNNAGRSIRRSLALSYDRFHDFERTMALNYFGALRLIMGLLPGMRERHRGHVINISSEGVQIGVPRFAAYVASKAALDAFTRVAQVEVLHDGVAFTTVYMPLVRTEMIAPTGIYRHFPTLSPEAAGDLVIASMVTRQKVVSTLIGFAAGAAIALAPRALDPILYRAYRFFPDSRAARGVTGAPVPEAEGDSISIDEALASAEVALAAAASEGGVVAPLPGRVAAAAPPAVVVRADVPAHQRPAASRKRTPVGAAPEAGSSGALVAEVVLGPVDPVDPVDQVQVPAPTRTRAATKRTPTKRAATKSTPAEPAAIKPTATKRAAKPAATKSAATKRAAKPTATKRTVSKSATAKSADPTA